MAELLAADIDERCFICREFRQQCCTARSGLLVLHSRASSVTHMVSESPMALFTTHSVAAGVTVHLRIMTLAGSAMFWQQKAFAVMNYGLVAPLTSH